jgi:small neutral amino acid transporter SnatA (MarC family)
MFTVAVGSTGVATTFTEVVFASRSTEEPSETGTELTVKTESSEDEAMAAVLLNIPTVAAEGSIRARIVSSEMRFDLNT